MKQIGEWWLNEDKRPVAYWRDAAGQAYIVSGEKGDLSVSELTIGPRAWEAIQNEALQTLDDKLLFGEVQFGAVLPVLPRELVARILGLTAPVKK